MLSPEQNKELKEQFNPEGSLLRRVQLRELEILKSVDKICQEHGIKYWLSSGTLLGAVRHGGFIPWDDDIDIEMLREDYVRFKKISQKEFEKYGLVNHTQEIDPEYVMPYGKVRDIYSYFEEKALHSTHYKFQGTWIDVFVMEPSRFLLINKIAASIQYRLIYSWEHINNKFIRISGKRFCGFLVNNLIFPFLRQINKIGNKGQMRHTLGTYLFKDRRIEDIESTIDVKFEGQSFKAPKYWDRYLTRMFGNYMKLPPSEKRIAPHIVKVELLPRTN